MTTRKDLSVLENVWNDAQRVSQEDMQTEQNRNNQIDAAMINNHFGSGILLSAPQQATLWDTNSLGAISAALVASGDFDGTGLSITTQPSDINLGNQLEVELTDSNVFGRFSVKVAIIGLAFDNTVQMDRFYFYRNEKQVTSKHYKSILTIFTNDFKGNHNCSRTLGGRIVIRETASFQLSRDPLMVSQDVEPDLFWRDFKVATQGITLSETIQTGMGTVYSIDALNINTTGISSQELNANDVTSQVGQKFKATTNNIQKITLLLAVQQNGSNVNTEFDWTGDLVISVYALQTSVSCPSDIVPELAIDFDPSNVPLAQISYTEATLKDYGYVLNNVLQPIDFVFNSTAIGSNIIVPDKYYAVTIKRSGANTSGTILVGTGNDRTENSRLTLFSGVWVDILEQDLWFQVWTDAAKVADGQGYDAGNGIMITKTTIDDSTGATIDNSARYYSFSDTGENTVNNAVIEAILEGSVVIQDERTGNPVNSRQKFVPTVSFVTTSGLTDLKNVSEPLIIGAIQDSNPKINPLLTKNQNIPGLVHGDIFCILNPDPDLLSLNLLGSKLIPNSKAAQAYRIFKATLCTDGYGDVNADGIIDDLDIVKAATLIGESIHLNSTQIKIASGEIDTLELLRADVDADGYVTTHDIDLISNYVNRSINSFPSGSTFTHMCLEVQQLIGRNDGYFDCSDGYVRLDGYTGINIVDSTTLSPAELIYDGYILTPSIELGDSTFTTIPFPGVTYQIVPQPFWQPYLLMLNSDTRKVPASFTSITGIPDHVCSTPLTYQCTDKNDIVPSLDVGRNDFFVPDHLIIGKGDILRPNGDFYKVDFEIGTIILNLPQIPLNESAINLMSNFIVDRSDGFTNAGYNAMRYADCTTVQAADLALGRIRFSVSLQAFVQNADGYNSIDGYGVIVDPIAGVYLDQTTGILKLSLKDLYVDNVFLTLISKIQIMVYLKKAGWNNTVINVDSTAIQGLIS